MAVLMTDLRDRSVLYLFGALGLLNLVGSIVIIVMWIFGVGLGSFGSYTSDRKHLSLPMLLFCAFVHFLPTLIFLSKYSMVRRFGADAPDQVVNSLDL